MSRRNYSGKRKSFSWLKNMEQQRNSISHQYNNTSNTFSLSLYSFYSGFFLAPDFTEAEWKMEQASKAVEMVRTQLWEFVHAFSLCKLNNETDGDDILTPNCSRYKEDKCTLVTNWQVAWHQPSKSSSGSAVVIHIYKKIRRPYLTRNFYTTFVVNGITILIFIQCNSMCWSTTLSLQHASPQNHYIVVYFNFHPSSNFISFHFVAAAIPATQTEKKCFHISDVFFSWWKSWCLTLVIIKIHTIPE